MKIIVTHHPFDEPNVRGTAGLIGSTAARYKRKGHSAVVVQAGTATSSRTRGELNSFNIVRIDRSKMDVKNLAWQPEEYRFSASSVQDFEYSSREWATARPSGQLSNVAIYGRG